jgi:hypothetical protein
MSPATVVGLVVLGVVALVVVIGVFAKLVLAGLRGPLERRIAEQYRDEDILLKDLGANCFGLESGGVWQVRGNGGLVLTRECLHFFMFLPKKEFRVPLDAVTEVTFVKSHLGKTVGYDLLKVRFTADGQPDSLAWFVTDPTAWRERIEAMRAGSAAR